MVEQNSTTAFVFVSAPENASRPVATCFSSQKKSMSRPVATCFAIAQSMSRPVATQKSSIIKTHGAPPCKSCFLWLRMRQKPRAIRAYLTYPAACGLHSDLLAGPCTPFRSQQKSAGRIALFYLVCYLTCLLVLFFFKYITLNSFCQPDLYKQIN